MKVLLSVLLIAMTGCVNLTPQHTEENATKKKIEKQKQELERNLKLNNSYKIEGRYIYFYSPEGKLVKNIDIFTRNEFYFDDKEKLVERIYHPKKEVKSLGRGASFQERGNFYNTLALLTRSEIWMYGLYNNSVSYSYDELLRLTEEVYRDSKETIYTTKKYSYKNSFNIDKISIYDRNKRLVEIEEYLYKGGRLSEVIYKDGSGMVKDKEKLIYREDRLIERRSKESVKKYIYGDGVLKRIEEYDTAGKMKVYHEMNHDRSGRVIKRDTYSSAGALTMREEYTY